ncbi:MAG: 23S rRNA (uracil-5-)-methyltransferase RumA, partial [Armatimonadetes bacterium]|nr:23S rRNA (uracil-5-)-methyltransferase RumA [Armatimonadota bacterium]
SGTGLFAAVAVQAGARVYTVENSPAAVEDARVNLPEEVTVLHTPATRGLQLLRERGISPDVVILDPPRAGCDSSSLKALTAISPRRMVYVSCDPATQARDVRLLVEAGYQLKSVQPIDLFPQTYHVETVVAIEPRP